MLGQLYCQGGATQWELVESVCSGALFPLPEAVYDYEEDGYAADEFDVPSDEGGVVADDEAFYAGHEDSSE